MAKQGFSIVQIELNFKLKCFAKLKISLGSIAKFLLNIAKLDAVGNWDSVSRSLLLSHISTSKSSISRALGIFLMSVGSLILIRISFNESSVNCC